MSDNSKSKKRSWTAKLILGALLAFFLFELQYVGRIILFDFVNPSSSPYIRAEQERLLEEGKHPVLYQWVDYDQISPYLIRAVVAAEDADFTTAFVGTPLKRPQKEICSQISAPPADRP